MNGRTAKILRKYANRVELVDVLSHKEVKLLELKRRWRNWLTADERFQARTAIHRAIAKHIGCRLLGVSALVSGERK